MLNKEYKAALYNYISYVLLPYNIVSFDSFAYCGRRDRRMTATERSSFDSSARSRSNVETDSGERRQFTLYQRPEVGNKNTQCVYTTYGVFKKSRTG